MNGRMKGRKTAWNEKAFFFFEYNLEKITTVQTKILFFYKKKNPIQKTQIHLYYKTYISKTETVPH